MLLDKKFEELQARELEEKEREAEFSESVEEARKALEDDRRKFEEEKEEFERSHPEEELDSGIGSRNESAELYEADEEDVEDAIEDSEEYEEEELVPPRRNKYDFFSVNAILSTDLSPRWYPEVGKAPPPNINSVRGRVRHVNKNYNPKSAKR